MPDTTPSSPNPPRAGPEPLTHEHSHIPISGSSCTWASQTIIWPYLAFKNRLSVCSLTKNKTIHSPAQQNTGHRHNTHLQQPRHQAAFLSKYHSPSKRSPHRLLHRAVSKQPLPPSLPSGNTSPQTHPIGGRTTAFGWGRQRLQRRWGCGQHYRCCTPR